MFSPEALGMPPQTRITITWIDLEETDAKVRMQKRGDPRDDWKLTHWDEYVKRRIDPPQHSSIHRFDNLQFNEANFKQLIEKLISD